MPTYVYKFVDTGETIEVQQAFEDPTLTEYPHPDSGEMLPVKKVFTPVGVTFKGSGFFKTDNRGSAKKGSTKQDSDSSGSSAESTGGDSSGSTSSAESTSSGSSASSGGSTSSGGSSSPSTSSTSD